MRSIFGFIYYIRVFTYIPIKYATRGLTINFCTKITFLCLVYTVKCTLSFIYFDNINSSLFVELKVYSQTIEF